LLTLLFSWGSNLGSEAANNQKNLPSFAGRAGVVLLQPASDGWHYFTD
jgi:hypothetical protein